MGADIYLNSIYEVQRELYYPAFQEACAIRDALPQGSDAAKKAQEAVYEAWAKMDEKGYFRDSYNGSNFVNKLGLSWWQDIKTDDEGFLPLAQAQWFLDQVYERYQSVFPTEFNRFCAEAQEEWGLEAEKERQEWDDFFRGKFEQLTSLLRTSIELEEPLYCSV